jgi:hypothetical protein
MPFRAKRNSIMKKILSTLAIVLAVGTSVVAPGMAVAKAPVYKAAGPKGGVGYTTSATGENRYAVVYTGDSRMKRDVVANYALLRAAELTTESGFEWFAVLSTTVKDVEVGSADDMASRTGQFMGNPNSTTTGAGSDQSAGSGTNEPGIPMGPSTGGFGGGDVPPAVLERWKPKKVVQAVLIIQVGKGDNASFPDVTKQPEIFDAKSTAEEIRATMK